MKGIVGKVRSLEGLVEDKHGEFTKPTRATEIKWTVEPTELAKVAKLEGGGQGIQFLKPGKGTLRAKAVYPDLGEKDAGSIPLRIEDLPVTEKETPPAFTGPILWDPD